MFFAAGKNFTGRKADLFTSDRRGTKSRAAYAARHKYREGNVFTSKAGRESEDVKKMLCLLSEERLSPRSAFA